MATAHRWTPTLLRHAIWLVFPPTVTGRPNLTAAAAATGVSARSLRRWLAGGATPTPEHATALRRALLPDPGILARQEDEHHWATEAAAVITAPRGRGIDPAWRSRGWHKPHVLRVLTNQDLGLSRPAVGLANPAKPFYPPHGWDVTAAQTFPNRPEALLSKHEQLDRVAATRVSVRADIVPTGRHECWLIERQ